MSYDPILRARKKALDQIREELSDTVFDTSERAIDIFFDCIEIEMQNADKVVRNEETGALTVITDTNDSSNALEDTGVEESD